MRNNKGITLVALICTIIVMLILLAVSITNVLSENGITQSAKNTTNELQQRINEEEKWAQNMIDEF